MPIIDLRITFDSGSVNDGDNEGILSFSINLLHQQLLNNKKIISYFEEIGAQYNSSVGKEKSYISLRFVSTTHNIRLISETINEMLSLNGISDELISENKVKVGSMGIMKVHGCQKCIFKAEYNWDKLHSLCLGIHGPNQEGTDKCAATQKSYRAQTKFSANNLMCARTDGCRMIAA